MKNNLASPLDKASKTGNGLNNTLNKSPSSPFIEQVKKRAGFPTNKRPGRHANEFDGVFTSKRAGLPSPSPALGTRPIKGSPSLAGTPSATARRRQNISTFNKQSAERLNAKNPIDNRAQANEFAGITAANDKTAAPILSDEAISSNGRLAKSLNKTSDFSAIKGHIEPGLKKGDPKAIAETHDLINQMNKSATGHGDKLAKELGLDTSKANVVGGTGSDDLRDFGGTGTTDETDATKTPTLLAQPDDKPALQDAGLIDKSGNWTGTHGVNNVEDFYTNHPAQERAFADYMAKNVGYLRRNGSFKIIGKTFPGLKGEGIKITRAGLLAAAQKQGHVRVKEY